MADHEQMRPECAAHFATLDAACENLRSGVQDLRKDQKETLSKIESNRVEILKALDRVGNEIAALNVKARGWGAIGGLFAALLTIAVAVTAWAFR